MEKLKVLAKKVGEEMKLVEFDRSLSNMQKLVGGKLEVVSLPHGIDMWFNEEGRLLEQRLNLVTLYDMRMVHEIVGTVFFASLDEEGEVISLSEEQMEWLKSSMMKNTTPVSYEDGREPNDLYVLVMS